MYTVSIQLTSISAERLSEILPPKIQFQVNLSIPSAQPYERNNNIIIPFIFTIGSIPPVVQINIRGQAIVMPKNDPKKIFNEIRKQIPQAIVQTVFTNAVAESIILSKSLGVPPPIPPIQLPQPRKGPTQPYTPVQ